jgi:two-component system sensor histidine kinase TctE
MQATISLRNRISKEGAVEGLNALVHFRSVAG